jgi:hypothetical protein
VLLKEVLESLVGELLKALAAVGTNSFGGDTIVVTMPGTRFSVTYRMLEDPQRSDLMLDDRDAPITRAEFLARAWKAANDKARELGWIV